MYDDYVWQSDRNNLSLLHSKTHCTESFLFDTMIEMTDLIRS